MSGLLQGKKILILGVANDKSLAWGIAKAAHDQGARLAFSYAGEAFKKRVEPLASELNADFISLCNVSEPETIKQLFADVEKHWGKFDGLIHAIGFSDKDELRGRFVDCSRSNFLMSMDISCYSFLELARHADPLMNDGGSILTLTYYGAEKVMPNYNVMGPVKAALEASVRAMAVDFGKRQIRVNAISAGPVKTLAASGIGDFRYILKWNEYNAPLKRNTTLEDVGGAAVYLLSQLASGTTGEVLHVDSGYHVVGMKDPEAPDISVVMSEQNN